MVINLKQGQLSQLSILFQVYSVQGVDTEWVELGLNRIGFFLGEYNREREVQELRVFVRSECCDIYWNLSWGERREDKGKEIGSENFCSQWIKGFDVVISNQSWDIRIKKERQEGDCQRVGYLKQRF